MKKANNYEEYASWHTKYYNRLANDLEAKNLLNKYKKRFGSFPYIYEQLGACSYMEYEELLEKVKICLTKNIDIIHLEIPDYDELLKQGILF